MCGNTEFMFVSAQVLLLHVALQSGLLVYDDRTVASVSTMWSMTFRFVWYRASSGGAISIDSSGPTGLAYVSIKGCNFTRNTAYRILFTASQGLEELQGSGGALRMFAGALWVSNTSFIGNSAAFAGGAILSGQTCLQVAAPYFAPHSYNFLSLVSLLLSTASRKPALHKSCPSLVVVPSVWQAFSAPCPSFISLALNVCICTSCYGA